MDILSLYKERDKTGFFWFILDHNSLSSFPLSPLSFKVFAKLLLECFQWLFRQKNNLLVDCWWQYLVCNKSSLKIAVKTDRQRGQAKPKGLAEK